MSKAIPRVLFLLALWLTASVVLSPLVEVACAQCSSPDNEVVGPRAKGDPDQPDPSGPPPDPGTSGSTSGNPRAGYTSGQMSWTRNLVTEPAYWRITGRIWLESLWWALRSRLSW